MKAFTLLFTLLAAPVQAQSLEASLVQLSVPIQRALSADNIPEGRLQAATLASAGEKALAEMSISHPQHVNVRMIALGSQDIVDSTTDADARLAFGNLAKGIVEMIRLEPSIQAQWQLFYCSMTEPYGFWVQPKGEKITNPYWGSEMLHCGVKKKW